MARCRRTKANSKKPKRKIKAVALTQWTPRSSPEEAPVPLSPIPPPDEDEPPATKPAFTNDESVTTPTKATTKTADKIHPLLTLPPEIIDVVLQHTLRHPTPIPVTALFARQTAHMPPPLDYRILHSCRELYLAGLRHYYGLNTFSISLSLFSTAPRTVAADRWPHGCGLGGAAMFVRSVNVSAREFRNWRDAVPLLRGFDQLDKVVFDIRDDWGVDCGEDGGMRFDGGWVEFPAEEGIRLALGEGGVSVGADGLWVGAETAEEAGKLMGYLHEAILEGVSRLRPQDLGVGETVECEGKGMAMELEA